MHVGRHGVPHASRGQFGHSHLQLARGQHLRHQHLVDVALVAHLQTAHVSHNGVLLGHLAAGIFLVCGGAVEVELGRMLRICAGERDVAVALSYIQSLLVANGKGLVAHGDDAFSLTHVEHSHLATLREVCGFQWVDGLKREHFVHGHGSAHYHAVVERVNHVHLIGCKQRFHQEVAAQTRGVVTLCVVGMRRIAYLIVCLHQSFSFCLFCVDSANNRKENLPSVPPLSAAYLRQR